MVRVSIEPSQRERELSSTLRPVEVARVVSVNTPLKRARNAGRLERCVIRLEKEYPQDMSMRISHEAIYHYIYVLPQGMLKTTLIKAL